MIYLNVLVLAASFLGIRSPLPYKYRKFEKKLFLYGMNFAVGGSGVFDTGYFQKNLSMQIVDFNDQLQEGVFQGPDLSRSTALVSVNGNDYLYVKDNGGSWEVGLILLQFISFSVVSSIHCPSFHLSLCRSSLFSRRETAVCLSLSVSIDR